jgi:hypothetical protein
MYVLVFKMHHVIMLVTWATPYRQQPFLQRHWPLPSSTDGNKLSMVTVRQNTVRRVEKKLERWNRTENEPV